MRGGSGIIASLRSTQNPDTAATNKTFDAAGNVLTRQDAKNQTTHYPYDAFVSASSLSTMRLPAYPSRNARDVNAKLKCPLPN
jgi:YD repeat-containing protein